MALFVVARTDAAPFPTCFVLLHTIEREVHACVRPKGHQFHSIPAITYSMQGCPVQPSSSLLAPSLSYRVYIRVDMELVYLSKSQAHVCNFAIFGDGIKAENNCTECTRTGTATRTYFSTYVRV